MRFLEAPKRLLAILGPTAVGKTDLALQLAERLNAEIVSVDSRLFYRGMDTGTAKPTPEEQRRVPHHLIDVANPDDNWSLAIYQAAARHAIEGIQQRGNLPILVGGTGQYVWAVLQGWKIPAQQPDTRLRQALETWGEAIGPEALYGRLAALDPEAATHIEPRNLRRTVRAMEVIFRTGRRFSEQRAKEPSPYTSLIIGLTRPREALYARVDNRIDAMLAAGLVEEVRRLLDQGYGPDLPTMSAIGYQEISAYLRGETSLEEAVHQMRRRTRQFIRRQANWFKTSDPSIHWFDAGKTSVEEVERFVREAET